MENNKIVVETMNTALLTIETALTAMSSNFEGVSAVSSNLSNAWDSENAAIVKSHVKDIYDKLGLLKTSVDNIRTKVQQVVQSTVQSDVVNINGGGTNNN